MRKSTAAFLISFLCFVASAHARSISVIGDVQIDIGEDKFQCDKIECPLTAERCVVSKEKDPKDPAVLVRSNFCYSKTGEIVQKSVTNEAVDPKTEIKFLVEANRSGSISTINSFNSHNFDEKAFAAQMGEFQKNLNDGMENLQKNLNQMNYDLAHMFD